MPRLDMMGEMCHIVHTSFSSIYQTQYITRGLSLTLTVVALCLNPTLAQQDEVYRCGVDALGTPMVVIPCAYKSSTSEDFEGLNQDLDRVEEVLETASASLVIVGHTDNVGGQSYNQDLGLARAKTLVDILEARGISSDRMRVFSCGERLPIADNGSEDGRSANRRIEIYLTNAEKESHVLAALPPVIPEGVEGASGSQLWILLLLLLISYASYRYYTYWRLMYGQQAFSLCDADNVPISHDELMSLVDGILGEE